MRILMVARHPVGGIRTFLRYVYSQPVLGDCRIRLVAPSDDLGDYLARYVPGRFEVVRSGQSVLEIARVVRREIAGEQFDLLHSHGVTTAVATELGRLGCAVPHLPTIHDVFLPEMFVGPKGQIRRWGLNLVLRRCEAIHAVGGDCAANFLSHMPLVKRDRVHAILNGIDTERFAKARPVDARAKLGLASDTILVGFFGRFMAQKGFRTLVDAVEILVREAPSSLLRVLTFGWGGFIREDYQYLRDKGLRDYFVQLPNTDEPERWMKSVDVVAMPSRWEACPLQPMEALAAGVPIVGTDCLGLREVLEGTPAPVVRPGDPVQLASGVRMALSLGTRGAVADYAPTAVQRFDVSVTAEKLRRLYLSVLHPSRLPLKETT